VLWAKMAENLGLRVDFMPTDWKRGWTPPQPRRNWQHDQGHEIKAVMAVHNETSTGITSNIAALRRAMDDAKHPALLMWMPSPLLPPSIIAMTNGAWTSPWRARKGAHAAARSRFQCGEREGSRCLQNIQIPPKLIGNGKTC